MKNPKETGLFLNRLTSNWVAFFGHILDVYKRHRPRMNLSADLLFLVDLNQ